MTEQQSITEWCAANAVRVEIDKDRGAQVDGDKWEHHAYVLTLHVGDRSHSGIDWRQGYGIEDSPTDRPDAVLDALITDATAYTNAGSFEDFASDFGYDPDSRKAEALYRACGEVADWLPELLGGRSVFEHVAFEVERL